jgi:hypothetical protein
MHCTIGVSSVAANDFAPAIVRRVSPISVCTTRESSRGGIKLAKTRPAIDSTRLLRAE